MAINGTTYVKWRIFERKYFARYLEETRSIGSHNDRILRWMSIVTDQEKGLLPLPNQIALGCNCPDWAELCKHLAAVLYGVGHRLDQQPELLFTLRGVNAKELITGDISLPDGEAGTSKTIADN
jgi:hypothetical protein